MSRDKARLRNDRNEELPQRRPSAPTRSSIPRRSPPPRPQPPRQRSIWPWLLLGCAGGIVLLVLAAAITVFVAVRNATGNNPIIGNSTANYTKQNQQTVQLTVLTQIQIHDPIGNVTVMVDPNATVATITTLKKTKAASSDDANKQFDTISVQVNPTGTPNDTLYVSANVPENGGIFGNHTTSVDLTITLPFNSVAAFTPTAISTGVATSPTPTTSTTPLTLNIDMSIGNAIVNGMSGILLIKDDIGDITVDSATLSASSHLQTGTGKVTFNGSIDTTPGANNATPRYKLQSERGSIEVSLPNDTNVILDANTNTGTISSDFPINVQTSSDGSANFYGPLLTNSPSNSAQAVLTLDVSTGNITVHRV